MMMDCRPQDPCYQFGGKIKTMSDVLAAPQTPTGLPSGNLTETGLRKRTVPEAIMRARGHPLFRISSGLKKTPLAPYAMLFQGLTYGLILLDPGNRLEGGLID